jgi:hypothetical protein
LTSFCSWLIRLLLPITIGILAALLYALWFDAPKSAPMSWIAAGTALVVPLLAIVLWCIAAWTVDDGGRDTRGDPV